MTFWIGILGAAVSAGGAAFAWWRSTASRVSAEEAKLAFRRAEETLDEIRQQAATLEALIADAVPEPLALEPAAGVTWHLRNLTDREIGIERLENAAHFSRRPFEALPVTIPARGTAEVVLVAMWGSSVPATMVLKLQGSNRTVQVPIPPDAG